MQRDTVPLGRWLRTTALAAVPLAVAFGALSGVGYLPPGVAVLSWAGLSLLAALIARYALADIVALARHADQLARGETTSDERLGFRVFGRELAAAIGRLQRSADERLARLAAGHDELERALDALPGPLLLINRERTVLRANRAARALLGEDLAQRDLAQVLRNPDLLSALEDTAHDGVGRDAEVALPAPVERLFAARIEPLPEPGPAGASLAIALTDLTAVRRSEQMRADFVANASHEIRTPLATLIGFIETLKGPARDDTEARERFLTVMAQHAARMARLVDDLLSLSRIEMNEHTPPTERVALSAILEGVRDNLAWQAEQRGVQVVLDLDPALPLAVGDADELTQVFQNLVDNAIKYGAEHGTVTVRAAHVDAAPSSPGWALAEQGALAVAIADQGEGIAREHQPRLTERFYRVDTARSRELGGTGLGLAIVKHIVNRHRGALAIESVEGEGSTFTVYLQPAEPTAEPATGAPND